MSLPTLPLPQGITSRYIDCSESVGLKFHILEAGQKSQPLVLFIHGYPEIAFSWRKVMLPIADLGYHVIALDQRGYGRTTGWKRASWKDTDMRDWSMTNLVRDCLALVNAIGHDHVHLVVGHDFGAVAASMCALMRPDFFKACVLMSHPFKGSPTLPFNTANKEVKKDGEPDIHEQLAQLPKPRKHYKWYNSTEHAAEDWDNPPQGMSTYLRGYFHLKSADWHGNNTHPLKAWSAEELAKLPHYYVMPLNSSMPEAIRDDMAGEDATKTERWLPQRDLDAYVQEWQHTGFQGALNWYRCMTDPDKQKDVLLFAGTKIQCPLIFISGENDWGNYQEPNVLQKMSKACADYRGEKMVKHAGHWPQQEQPEQVVDFIQEFLHSLNA